MAGCKHLTPAPAEMYELAKQPYHNNIRRQILLNSLKEQTFTHTHEKQLTEELF